MFRVILLSAIALGSPLALGGPLAYDFEGTGIGGASVTGMFTAVDGALTDGEIVAAELESWSVRWVSAGVDESLSSAMDNAFLNVWSFAPANTLRFFVSRFDEDRLNNWEYNLSITPGVMGVRTDDGYFFDTGATTTVTPASSYAVPAPATLALFGLGLAGLGWSRRKQHS